MSAVGGDFQKRLNGLRRRRVGGLALAAGLGLTGDAALLLTVYAALDYFLAFSNAWLMALDVLALGYLVAVGAARLAKAMRFSAWEMAAAVDRATGNRRGETLCAHELSRGAPGADDGFRAYLAGKAMEKAAAVLAAARFRDYFPLGEIRRRSRGLAWKLAAALVILGSQPSASGVILRRIFDPASDIPPYSPYVFAVTPEGQPKAVYGGDLELSATVKGPPLKSQVWLVTRGGGETHKTACFREDGDRFSRRIEKITTPLEFCFMTGKARTTWRRVELLTRPRISLAKIKVRPPAYSRLPAKSFFVGGEGVEALKGSRAEMLITSNRPLSGGALVVRGADTRIVKGVVTDANSASFAWDIDQAATLSVTIRDIRGTESETPLVIGQRLVPDAPPEISLAEPELFMMATPNASLPLRVLASDDLGLRRVDLVRAVLGYHDRVKPLGPKTFAKDLEEADSIDLKRLGVLPGETLEFYAEATDFNPAMTGLSSSEVARVLVISEDEYAKMLRERIKVEEILERFALINDSFESLEQAARKLDEALKGGQASKAELDKLLKELREANGKARKTLDAFANDFPIYDLERQTRKTIDEMFLQSVANEAILSGADAGKRGDLKAKVSRLLKSTELGHEQARQMVGDAAELKKIAAVMGNAATFNNLLKRQEELTRRLRKHVGHNKLADPRGLSAMAQEEREIRAELERMRGKLLDDAAALPDNYSDLKQSAAEFAAKLDELKIPGLLGEAAEAAAERDGAKAHDRSSAALEKMRSLVKQCSGGAFGAMTCDKILFEIKECMRMTAQQMLEAILSQGVGQGLGGAGGEDGYAVGGHSPLNVPVVGPAKTRLAAAAAGKGRGNARGKGGLIGKGDREFMRIEQRKRNESESLSPDKVPLKYRDAVKKYFGE